MPLTCGGGDDKDGRSSSSKRKGGLTSHPAHNRPKRRAMPGSGASAVASQPVWEPSPDLQRVTQRGAHAQGGCAETAKAIRLPPYGEGCRQPERGHDAAAPSRPLPRERIGFDPIEESLRGNRLVGCVVWAPPTADRSGWKKVQVLHYDEPDAQKRVKNDKPYRVKVGAAGIPAVTRAVK